MFTAVYKKNKKTRWELTTRTWYVLRNIQPDHPDNGKYYDGIIDSHGVYLFDDIRLDEDVFLCEDIIEAKRLQKILSQDGIKTAIEKLTISKKVEGVNYDQ